MTSTTLVIVGVVVLIIAISVLWWLIRGHDQMDLARVRRAAERRAFEELEKKLDTAEAPAAIQNLRLLRGASSAVSSRQSVSADESALKQLVTFPGGGSEIAQLGYRIFKWLLVLTVVLLGILALYGWSSYPTEGDVRDAVGGQTAPTARFDVYTSLQAAWVQQIKDLGQLFLLTPVFPLLGAVIGYIFGVRKSNGDGGLSK